jgi:hypothetical protein
VSDVLQGDRFDGIDQNFSVIHPIAPPHRNVRAFPNADAASYEPAAHPFPETFCENHGAKNKLISRDAAFSKSCRVRPNREDISRKIPLTMVRLTASGRTALQRYSKTMNGLLRKL